MHIIEGLMITRPLENSAACFLLFFLLRCFCTGDVHLHLYYFREGHPASIPPPCRAPPFRLSPTHSLPFIPPPPWGCIETGCQQLFSQHPVPFHTTGIMPSNTSHQSNPALPLLMSDFGPNRPTRSHICHSCMHTQILTLAEKKLSLVGK